MCAHLTKSRRWELQHDMRRLLFRVRHPSSYASLQKLRAEADGDYSLKPFDDLKCIFVHIPKCAGSSISRSLFGNLGGGHMTARKYQIVFSKKEFDKYFKFAFVRNPWDRAVSAFLFLKEGGTGLTDRQWAEQHLSDYSDFDSFVRGWLNRENVQAGWHFTPQYVYVTDPLGDLLVDFVGYFESLQEDYEFVRERLGTGVPLKRINRVRDRVQDFRHYYTDESKRIVADVYREDIELFGYEFDEDLPTTPLRASSARRDSDRSASGGTLIS